MTLPDEAIGLRRLAILCILNALDLLFAAPNNGLGSGLRFLLLPDRLLDYRETPRLCVDYSTSHANCGQYAFLYMLVFFIHLNQASSRTMVIHVYIEG